MPRVALLFTDGVGVGAADPAINPLARGEFLLSQFSDGRGTRLPHDGVRHLVDTTFGVPGRPQSASNQTALYTGLDAPRLTGQHLLGFPNAPLKALLAEHSIVARLTAAGRSARFVNGYPHVYLQSLGLMEGGTVDARLKRRLKPSASTLAFAAARVPFNTFDEVRRGDALTHDVDGKAARRRFPELPERTPAEAAGVFWKHPADFRLFEHFLADEAGHEQDLPRALEALATFDAFARAVIASRPDDCTVVICSNHGNVEDLSTRNHTLNPVAVLTFGPVVRPLETLADVGRLVLASLGVSA